MLCSLLDSSVVDKVYDEIVVDYVFLLIATSKFVFWSKGAQTFKERWITFMDPGGTIFLFRGQSTSRNRSFVQWTGTMRITAPQLSQQWQRLYLRMSRRFLRLLQEPHLFSQPQVPISSALYCCFKISIVGSRSWCQFISRPFWRCLCI